MTYKNINKNIKKYVCENCDYRTVIKCNFEKHLLTSKHLNTYKSIKKYNDTFLCECGKKYKHRQSLYSHKRKCNFLVSNILEKNDFSNKNSEYLEKILLKVVDENKEIKNIILEQNNTIQEQQRSLNKLVTKCETNTINNTIMQNNSFNLNIFLNENCKDALNMSDFLNSLQIEIKDLEYTKKHGINEGIIQLFLNRFRELGTYKRPIHCSDLKREILYVKDNNIWNKDEDKAKLKESLIHIQKKQINTVKDWEDKNPNWQDDTNKKDEYIEIVSNVMKELDDSKITKQLSKSIIINKNTKS